MYFFDLEDYNGTNRQEFNASVKSAAQYFPGWSFGGFLMPHLGDTYNYDDHNSTALETRVAFLLAVNSWYTASTICNNICNQTAYDIYYNEFTYNLKEFYKHNFIYKNSLVRPYRYYEERLISHPDNPSPFVGSYSDFIASYVLNGEIITGSTSVSVSVPATNGGFSSETITINYGNAEFSPTYYYNHDTALRNLMGSLKRLCKALDDDDFEDI